MGLVLKDQNTVLEFLSFEANKMGDKSFSILCDSLCLSKSISVLNFSKNEISNIGIGKY